MKNTPLDTKDYIILGTSFLILISSWLYLLVEYPDLPGTIAVHFNGAGEPDGYNSKNAIFIAPILFTLLSIGMFFGGLSPQKAQFPYKELTNSQKYAAKKTLFLSCLLLTSILFLILYSMIMNSVASNISLKWIVPTIIIMVILFISLTLFLKYKKFNHD